MTAIIRQLELVEKKLSERGSALLVTLMVIVGLSLLGLGFVALSETEAAIAVNQRNYTQTLQVAEAAGKVVVEWFQDPAWAVSVGIMPTNVDAVKVDRFQLVSGSPVNVGKYKAGKPRLFDKPFKPHHSDRFFGTEDNPDVLINNTTAPTFLSNFNNQLFNTNTAFGAAGAWCQNCDNTEGGVITDIRVYAPPIDGATYVDEPGWTTAAGGIPPGRGFWHGGSRFGLATIRVTAAKYNKPRCNPLTDTTCVVISQRSMKFVITEFPFPGPQGPIQSNASIDTTGNMKVHWGKVTANDSISVKRAATGMPWHDADEFANFERGYDNTVAAAQRVWPVPADATRQPILDFKDDHPWLFEFIGRTLEDHWYQARSRGDLEQLPGAVTGAYSYNMGNRTTPPGTPVCNPCNVGDAQPVGQSNMFQDQTSDTTFGDNFRSVVFPRIDYNFWKQLAVAADDQPHIYYLEYVSGKNPALYRDKSGCLQSFRQWVDTTGVSGNSNTAPCTGTPSDPGFFFFDTTNKLNPQSNGGGTLTPAESLSGKSMQMKGFIYLNSTDFGTTGMGAPSGYYSMPGEVFRDIGYLQVEETAGALQGKFKRSDDTFPCNPNTLDNCAGLVGAADGIWSYQDLPWGPRAGQFDYHVAKSSGKIARSSGTDIPSGTWFMVPYFENCTPGQAGNCSEPHEPYLNFIYPSSNNADGGVTIGWHDPSAGAIGNFRKPKRTSGGSPVNCTSASSERSNADEGDCTSNTYDRDGAIVELAPFLNGVFYNEGTFSSPGNADYFGSILIQGSVSDSGTPNVWFDEKLIKGDWPPSSFGLPRVYISSVQTDQ